jgi:hypothetical protein
MIPSIENAKMLHRRTDYYLPAVEMEVLLELTDPEFLLLSRFAAGPLSSQGRLLAAIRAQHKYHSGPTSMIAVLGQAISSFFPNIPYHIPSIRTTQS